VWVRALKYIGAERMTFDLLTSFTVTADCVIVKIKLNYVIEVKVKGQRALTLSLKANYAIHLKVNYVIEVRSKFKVTHRRHLGPKSSYPTGECINSLLEVFVGLHNMCFQIVSSCLTVNLRYIRRFQIGCA
jgi:hypothetical protein